MNALTPLTADQSYLRHFWHPVATVNELQAADPAGNGPIGRMLLDEPLVIAKLDGKYVAMRDRCAHRYAKLSVGKVLDNNRIQCPYHGWEYGASGRCELMPACPNDAIPKKAFTPAYACEERYGIIWVRLDSSWDCTNIPYCEAWENPEYKRQIIAEPYNWDSSAERRWENFTDFSHFAYVHPGTLYDPAYSEPAIVPVDRVGGELRFFMEPGRDMLDTLPDDSPLGSWNYRNSMPFSVNLSIRLYKNDKPFLLWTTSSPISQNSCRNFMIIAHTDDTMPDSQPLDFQKLVLAEDQPVIETQPGPIYLDEVSLPTDKISNQYRKWLRELSTAATKGEEAFKAALFTDVTESK
ncbi:aromatic ring-hydroxylating oxygenase subunit alpha [Paracoccus shandongensis]|uniref:aromatic ring-hydroxylating oxygenase subunit alpha n=1 Tax=Paracoccus shandongensis TaxID=2816048 RepID=UPI001A8CC3A1|nr:aromatic ring-hydroxylating dioxygenase subunit alpha [Paracoccus shandongensis]